MSFKLFEELGGLDTKEVVLLVLGVVAVAALFIAAARFSRRAKNTAPEREIRERAGGKKANVRALVYGALCVSLSFVLSYLKLFEMPMGGSITLLSMLPLTAYAAAFGPAYGFTAAFAYSLLQVVQGAYVVHPAQFLLDYILAFSCLGLASLFPKSLPLGVAVSGFGRFACSVISGVVFFSEYAPQGQNVWLYSVAYNGSSLGIDVLLCVLAACLPAVRGLLGKMKTQSAI